ncbi:MAG: glutaredoxin family protein [Actinobacteria bacterium]|nr:MAG: glutaredoxin family protein [Actinomycetota bacterium]
MSELKVQFVTREDCSLCDRARPIVTKAARRIGATVEEIDVDTSPELVREFGDRVPVVLAPDGTVAAEGVIDRRALVKRMRGARTSDA